MEIVGSQRPEWYNYLFALLMIALELIVFMCVILPLSLLTLPVLLIIKAKSALSSHES
jgi:hypothetical protein